MKWTLGFVAATLVALMGVGGAAAQTPEVGDLAPDFALEQLGGGSLELSQLQGKVVFINFFGFN